MSGTESMQHMKECGTILKANLWPLLEAGGFEFASRFALVVHPSLIHTPKLASISETLIVTPATTISAAP